MYLTLANSDETWPPHLLVSMSTCLKMHLVHYYSGFLLRCVDLDSKHTSYLQQLLLCSILIVNLVEVELISLLAGLQLRSSTWLCCWDV